MADDQNQNDAPVVSEESLKEAPMAESAQEAAEVIEQASPGESLNDSRPEKEEAPAEEPKSEEPKEQSKPKKEVSKNLEGIIESIEKLSVLELADLVKALEDRFGVTAAAPMAVAAAGAPAGGSEGPSEEQTSFDVVLTNGGANKIAVIKAVRELVPTLGLKEAKDLVEAAPKPVLEGVNKETANEAKTKLTAAGGTVELQ